jgi:hypothetical protein
LADDIEYGNGNKISLWLLGFLYWLVFFMLRCCGFRKMNVDFWCNCYFDIRSEGSWQLWPPVQPGVVKLNRLVSPEGGATSIAAFGALKPNLLFLPRASPGVIVVWPLRGYSDPYLNCDITALKIFFITYCMWWLES